MSFIAPKGTELIRLLGGGSVYEVGLVRFQQDEVVCKRLTPTALDSHEGRAAMIREARLCAMVDHPAIPKLIRVGNDWRGPFFLQSYIPGQSIAQIVSQWREKYGQVPNTLVRHIATESFKALAELVELSDEQGNLGIIHGDIGPEHVILGPIGEIRFVDLGAARFRDMERELVTNDKGTLPYVAPEIARGDAPISKTADQYALTATLLLLATGGPLCRATTEPAMLAEIAAHGIRRELFALAKAFLPSERDILYQALDPNPEKRPKSPRDILNILLSEEEETKKTELR